MLLNAVILLGCLVLTQGTILPDVQTLDEGAVKIKILSPSEMVKFLEENPKAIKLNPHVETKTSPISRALDVYELSWTLGDRKPNDGQVYTTVNDYVWFGVPANPELSVRYPASGTGREVTQLKIVTTQSTPDGATYLTEGGIGKNYVGFVVTGYKTYFWSWNVKVYAK